jgi:hypothetical protein
LREEPSRKTEGKNGVINEDDREVTDSLELEQLEGEPLRFGRRDRFARSPGEQPQVFLKRWKLRSAFRRMKLVQELLVTPLGPRRLQKLEILLRTLEGRKAWLEARLEHTVGLESIVRAAIERRPRNRRREGGDKGGGRP